MNELSAFLSLSPWGEIFFAVEGLIVGSFLNVVILRLPEGNDLVFKRSHCTQCKKALRAYHNIPVLSYVCLRGRCAFCRAKISIQYPLVECVTGFAFVAAYLRFGWSWPLLAALLLLSNLIVISVIDLYHRIIPDELSLGGMVAGQILVPATGILPWWHCTLGILIGGGSFLAVAYLYEKIAKRDGLGGGDIKMLGMLGAWLGHSSILPIILVSSVLGSVIGLAVLVWERGNLKTAIPFGPFLAAAAVTYLFFGERLLLLLFPLP